MNIVAYNLYNFLANKPEQRHNVITRNPKQRHDLNNQNLDRYKTIQQEIKQQIIARKLFDEITQWEQESIAKIKSAAEKAKIDWKRICGQPYQKADHLLKKLSNSLRNNRHYDICTSDVIKSDKRILDDGQNELLKLRELKIAKTDLSSIHLIKLENDDVTETLTNTSFLHNPIQFEKTTSENSVASKLMGSSTDIPLILQSQIDPYPSTLLITPSLKYQDVRKLFDYLRSLSPMQKYGPLSGDCDVETTQMERFLSQSFDFRNIPNEYIVHGVNSFRLGKPLRKLTPRDIIFFPNPTRKSFVMTVQEILGWQHSFKVYADQTVKGMNSDFLCKALQGLSESGEEASRMKFVVRISQCPILMEFDARLITRELKDQWPSRIKLVSVTGIDFAGRIHDVNDITTYVTNWKDVYEIDPKTGLPFVYNGRDFQRKRGASQAELHTDRLLKDLIRMARLRLYACDKEKVQIVVETGIGLGVFAGKSIGIDGIVRALSAKAIRTVLEQEGPNYEHIRGIVFALPIFDSDLRIGRRDDVYQAFVDEFDKSKYNGCIPVLIADQDMHRLTVVIAHGGFNVSELNPADSHGVFGEYWQNRGPAVEEKLAITTLGLLVQHHLINPYVLDPKHYRFV
ncbi:unnamed protein product [Adineta steineri]|uniref:Uncharacterized protein n=1 Tax=Adineta steineri TaxID=433720 RepID=A0A815L681_9BILA|nr:unnamed protein product [Adineta steineri]CAF1614485.1 unnamed protein product [Adineta steineri]